MKILLKLMLLVVVIAVIGAVIAGRQQQSDQGSDANASESAPAVDAPADNERSDAEAEPTAHMEAGQAVFYQAMVDAYPRASRNIDNKAFLDAMGKELTQVLQSEQVTTKQGEFWTASGPWTLYLHSSKELGGFADGTNVLLAFTQDEANEESTPRFYVKLMYPARDYDDQTYQRLAATGKGESVSINLRFNGFLKPVVVERKDVMVDEWVEIYLNMVAFE